MSTSRTKMILLADITVPKDRMRALRPEVVNDLAESIKERGQLQPILVRPKPRGKGYILDAGRHRLEAMIQLEHSVIECRVLQGLTADEALSVEIDENLIRADLSPSERAAHHTERKKLYLKLYPETKRGAAGGEATAAKAGKAKRQNVAEPTYAKATAKKIGKTKRTVERDVARGEKIHPQALADLQGTCLDKGDELDALGKLPVDEQRKLAARAKAGEKVSAKTKVKALPSPKRKRQRRSEGISLNKLMAEPCDDCDTEELRWQRSAENHLSALVALTAYSDREFKKQWRQYGITSELAALAEDADKECPTLIGHFKHVAAAEAAPVDEHSDDHYGPVPNNGAGPYSPEVQEELNCDANGIRRSHQGAVYPPAPDLCALAEQKGLRIGTHDNNGTHFLNKAPPGRKLIAENLSPAACKEFLDGYAVSEPTKPKRKSRAIGARAWRKG